MANGLEQLVNAQKDKENSSNLTDEQLFKRLVAFEDKVKAQKNLGKKALEGTVIQDLLKQYARNGKWTDAQKAQAAGLADSLSTLVQAYEANKGQIGNKEVTFTAAGSRVLITGNNYGEWLKWGLENRNEVIRDVARLYVLILGPLAKGLNKISNALGGPTLFRASQFDDHIAAIEEAANNKGWKLKDKDTHSPLIVDGNGNPVPPEQVADLLEDIRSASLRSPQGYKPKIQVIPYEENFTVSAQPQAAASAPLSSPAAAEPTQAALDSPRSQSGTDPVEGEAPRVGDTTPIAANNGATGTPPQSPVLPGQSNSGPTHSNPSGTPSGGSGPLPGAGAGPGPGAGL